MVLTEEMKAKIKKQCLTEAACAFLSNVDADDFPENFMDMLLVGKYEDGDKEIIPWKPLEDIEPSDMYNIIDDHAYGLELLTIGIIDKLYPEDNIIKQYFPDKQMTKGITL